MGTSELLVCEAVGVAQAEPLEVLVQTWVNGCLFELLPRAFSSSSSFEVFWWGGGGGGGGDAGGWGVGEEEGGRGGGGGKEGVAGT